MDATPKLDLGPYRLDTLLGKGGMGEVYRAWDVQLERWVAVKHLLIRGDEFDDPTRARFRREARILAKLRHASVVQVFELLERDDGDWLVMELIAGQTLKELLRAGPLAHGLATEYGRQVAEGLAAAHAEGIIHRDLKTENVMVLPSDEVRILDFGLAKQLSTSETGSISSTGQVIGTPRVMSPEQVQGLVVDPRTDLFALGVLLYELLTSRSPFQGGSIFAVLNRVVNHDPPPVRQSFPQIPAALSDLVDRLLRKKPEHRPADAAEVAREIAGILTAGILTIGIITIGIIGQTRRAITIGARRTITIGARRAITIRTRRAFTL
jgi:serine/threonine protein kinase